ncbi:hypothetical protein BDQ17DRAFT_1192165, partial [Cyathus striatus]
SNYVPPVSERSTIQACISASDIYIHTLEAALKSVQVVARDIQARLSNIRSYNEVQLALISPIRRLPDELLVEIFAYVQEGKISIFQNLRGQIWDLQYVCVHWRNLVLNTPLLWSSFEL